MKYIQFESSFYPVNSAISLTESKSSCLVLTVNSSGLKLRIQYVNKPKVVIDLWIMEFKKFLLDDKQIIFDLANFITDHDPKPIEGGA